MVGTNQNVMPVDVMPELSMDDVLRFDALDVAEKIAMDRDVEALGLSLFLSHNELKNRMLEERDDTTFSNELDRYLRIVTEIGFEVVGEYTFPSKPYGDEPVYTERLFILAHRTWAALLCFDTYGESRVNGGHVYYQWCPADGLDRPWAYTRSGGWHDYPDLWSGYHDCREAIRHNLCGLDEHGTWIKPWRPEGRHFLWLHGYNEVPAFDNHDYTAGEIARATFVRERVAAMPEWAREMFSPGIDLT